MPDTQYFTDIPGYPEAHSPYSHAVVANGFVFVSGQIATRPGGEGALDLVGTTTADQTRQSLENVDRVLRAAGSSLDKAVKITVLLTNPSDFKEMNSAYVDFFPGDRPARSVAQLGAKVPGVLVSIDAIATT